MTSGVNNPIFQRPSFGESARPTPAGSMEGEEAKADALQIEKQRKLNKATYQNNISAYIQKLQ